LGNINWWRFVNPNKLIEMRGKLLVGESTYLRFVWEFEGERKERLLTGAKYVEK